MLVDKTPRKTKINSGSDKHFESISSFKQEVILKLSHTLDSQEQIMISFTLDHLILYTEL